MNETPRSESEGGLPLPATATAEKPGYKTTEFYVSVLTALGALLSTVAGGLPAKQAATVAGISAGAYALSRGIAKFGAMAMPMLSLMPELKTLLAQLKSGAAKTAVLIYICAFGFAGCATTTGGNQIADRASAFASSPGGRILADTLITVAASAAEQYGTTRKIDKGALIAATLDGAAQSLRSLASTPQAQSPGAVAGATTIGAGLRAYDNTVSPIVAGKVMNQIQSGTSPDQAIENVATAMNAAAARTRHAAAGP
jgi:hypothetical protein